MFRHLSNINIISIYITNPWTYILTFYLHIVLGLRDMLPCVHSASDQGKPEYGGLERNTPQHAPPPGLP